VREESQRCLTPTPFHTLMEALGSGVKIRLPSHPHSSKLVTRHGPSGKMALNGPFEIIALAM